MSKNKVFFGYIFFWLHMSKNKVKKERT